MSKILISILFFLSLIFNYSCQKKEIPKEGEVKTMYQCPMHPQVIEPKKGNCPICGMELVPRKMIYKEGKWMPYEEEGKTKEKSEFPLLTTINIPFDREQIIGVKTMKLYKKKPFKVVRTYGNLEIGENKIYIVSLKFSGWIEKLYVDYEGKYVNKGDKLFDIYSPSIYQAEQELITSYERKDSLLFENVKRKFKLWGIKDFQIDEIIKNKTPKEIITFYSPYSGFVIEKNVFEGMKVDEGMELFKIADLSELWVLGNIYEYEIPFIKKDLKVEAESPYIKGKKFYGYIDYIYPEIEKETRTLKVRFIIKNPNLELKPGMYVNININISFDKEEIVIPIDAILFSGKYNYVFIKKEKGIFEPRVVELGPETEEGYIVLKGIEEGEEVVISGNFFIDSESKIKAVLKRIVSHD
jgi:multidrug efflux pump subunit AcrA (membrane-fusion protein)